MWHTLRHCYKETYAWILNVNKNNNSNDKSILVVVSMHTINLILVSCIQPYQPIYNGGSFGDNLKVL